MYGLTIFSGGSGRERFRRAVALGRQAEDAGFEAVWTGELYNRSATVPMALLAQGTQRVAVGSNIAYGVGRSPLMWAAEARDLDELSGGRLVLGLGNGTARMMSDWHGVSGEAPAIRLEELVDLLRKLWNLHDGPIHHDGRFYRLHLEPTADTPPPYRDRLPIWTAGVNARMVLAAGKVADGLVGHPMFTPEYVSEVVRPQLEHGAELAGRDVKEITLMGIAICVVDDDVDRARRQLAYSIAQYAASRVYDRLFELHGWAADQQRIRDAARARDVDAMIAAVPVAAVDSIGIACRPGELGARVVRYAHDYDHLDLVGPPWGLTLDDAEQAARTIVEEMRPILAGREPS